MSDLDDALSPSTTDLADKLDQVFEQFNTYTAELKQRIGELYYWECNSVHPIELAFSCDMMRLESEVLVRTLVDKGLIDELEYFTRRNYLLLSAIVSYSEEIAKVAAAKKDQQPVYTGKPRMLDL